MCFFSEYCRAQDTYARFGEIKWFVQTDKWDFAYFFLNYKCIPYNKLKELTLFNSRVISNWVSIASLPQLKNTYVNQMVTKRSDESDFP